MRLVELSNSLGNVTITCAVLIVLTACGGGGGSTTSAVSALSGTVIDGYIENAKVCADVNGNSVCDDGEPFTVTDANGNYTLTTLAGASNIIVETTANSKDKDDNGQTLEAAGRAPFTLSAPATIATGQEKFVVTPLTTMVSLSIQQDPSLTPTTAAAALVNQLGLGDPTKVNFFADYKASNNVNNTFMGQMAKGIADSLGEAEKLAKAEINSSTEFVSAKKEVFKDVKSRTWNAMVANIAPDGSLIKPPAQFKELVKAEVNTSVATIVTAAKFAPDKDFLNNFKVEDALAVRNASGSKESGKTRLYIGSCETKTLLTNVTEDKDIQRNQKLGISGGSDLQPVFCPNTKFATLATVEIGSNSPWPVPMAYALIGNNLASAKWKPFPGGGDEYYILTDEGIEQYDGNPNTSPKPFRPRTADPSNATIKSTFDSRCFTVTASGYGEKYCFDPVQLKGKKVSSLDPNCKSGYGSSCGVSQGSDQTFSDNAVGFNVTKSHVYDTYQFFPKSYAGSPSGISFTKISEAISSAKSAGRSVEACDEDITGSFTYFWKFIDGSKIKLTGVSGPGTGGKCDDNRNSNGQLTPDVVITAERTFCDIKGELLPAGSRGLQALEALCQSGGALNGVKISPEEIPYEIVKPNTSAKAKDIEVFKTGMFGITRLVTQKYLEQLNASPGSSFSPNGLAATIINRDIATGVYWAKNAPVFKLNFLNGDEKVVNDAAGKQILEAFSAPKFESNNIQTVQY